MPRPSKRILGIDPGYGRLGYALLEGTSSRPVCLAYGCIETSTSRSIPERLFDIQCACRELLERYHPVVLGIETLTAQKNVSTVIAVAAARGVVLAEAVAAKLTIIEVTPNQVKQALTGHGMATKQQVQTMVQRILGLPHLPEPDDAADAIAIALTVQPQVTAYRV